MIHEQPALFDNPVYLVNYRNSIMHENPKHLQFPISRRKFMGSLAATAALTVAACNESQPQQPGSSASSASTPAASRTIRLSENWQMQSSEVLIATGEQLSTGPAYGSWYTVRLPSTVLAGLVANGEYPNLFYAENLKSVPSSRFSVPWWYRNEFTLPSPGVDMRTSLYFKGINYRANVWLNGKQIVDQTQFVGAYRDYVIDITDAVNKDGTLNVLAIEVFPPDKTALAITFVDWAPTPPDHNMGIWQDVYLEFSGPVKLRYPHVLTDLDVNSLQTALLTPMVDLTNITDQKVSGALTGVIANVVFSQNITLNPGETRTVSFSPDQLSELQFRNPRVWWPWQLGDQNMYSVEFTFITRDGLLSDQVSTGFGIRQVTSRLQDGHRLFTVNGVDMVILGGGYAPDLLQRRSLPDYPLWQENQIRYVREMNLNAIRLEGKLEDDAFYDLCDRYGILVMAGWCCCSPWERWKSWKPEQHDVAMASLHYQIRRARTHPALLVWLNGSDNHPPEDIETQYLKIEADLHWPCPVLSCASDADTKPSGQTGVKMNGPYKWEPPIFWTTDTQTGGAWGFNTEVGPGAIPPPVESIAAMLPPDSRWPINAMWNFHCGKNEFASLDDYNTALESRFGKPMNLADYCWKAQAQSYETIRAMYEAFNRNKFKSTGEIQWMLNNAWPSMIWHLYDYFLRPGSAYFGAKLGCQPLHVMYSYDDQTIVVTNGFNEPFMNMTATVQVYDIDGAQKFQANVICQVPANGKTIVFKLPGLSNLSMTYFLRLSLQDSNGVVNCVNSYWLSLKPDTLDWNNSQWYVTPPASFCDYTLLQSLPRVNLSLTDLRSYTQQDRVMGSAVVTNSSNAIAMMVRLKLTQGAAGPEILPIYWEDNYFLLLPGESRRITGMYFLDEKQWDNPTLSVDCFNNARGVTAPT
ncbi:MAG TPA: glycoside hydrolase family 2 protein [Phycisphaerae bacterium]|nr:glycoside hydrolase family 2 protein [Phycisphaerae bacterium]